MTSSLPWVEKFRPSEFADIVLSPENAAFFEGILADNYIPNMLFYGPPGTGKTTTIVNLIGAYHRRQGHSNQGLMIHLNASDERGIEVIRSQINAFVGSKPLFGDGVKFVILDEVDYMTKNAQLALTYLINRPPVAVRFILICNYISRIDETLQSLFVRVHFNHLPPAAVVRFLKHIVDEERLPISDDTLAHLQRLHGSDIRSMVNYLQSNRAGTDILHDGVWVDLYARVQASENINVLTREVDLTCERFRLDPQTVLKDFLYFLLTKVPDFPLETIPKLAFALHAPSENARLTATYVFLTLLQRCAR